MSKNGKLELSRRKALASLGAIGVASAGAGLGTSAYFSDEESFEDNSLAAGELDLKVDWQQTYNGPIPGTDGEVGEHPVNAYPDTAVEDGYGDGLQDLEGVKYSGAGDVDPVFDAADVPACCDCDDDEYYLTYGGETYCIDAIDGDESAESFYNYDDGEWSSLNDDIQRPDTAVLFLYKDDSDDLHLFVIHNELDNERSSNDGFVASVTVEGAENCEWLNAEWTEQDDSRDNDQYQNADSSDVATADWAWQERKTDGGILGTIDETFGLRITSQFNDAATKDGDTIFNEQVNIERLVFLDGDETEEIELENDIGVSGDVGSLVIHSACGIESGADLPDTVFASEYYPEQDHLIQLDDIKPGDRGEVTFSLHLCDNPGYVWLTAANYSQDGGELTEPEKVAINESDDNISDVADVGEGDDSGHLAKYVDVTVWYDEDCDNVYDDGQEDGETAIFEGTLASLMEQLGADDDTDGEGMLPLDAGQAAEPQEYDCFPAEEGFCVGFEWEVSTEVGNIIQGDSVEFDLGFYTEQCRHNDGPNGEEPAPT